MHEPAGYGKPPTKGKFHKGVSGNPRGRPKGSTREAPYEALLGKKVLVRENGSERWLTAGEAFLLQLTKRGIEGGGPAARTMLDAIERAKAAGVARQPETFTISNVIVTPGSVNLALETLRMATIVDGYRQTAKTLLEPWLVEAALARLSPKQLSPEEQRIVVKATRTPNKVRWPKWWRECPRQ